MTLFRVSSKASQAGLCWQSCQLERGFIMTYYESAEGIILNREQVEREIWKHQTNPKEFFEDMGEKPFYQAQEVLNWLGY